MSSSFRIIFLVVLSYCAYSQKIQQKLPEKTRILFILDASGSMLEQWGRPNQTRMSVAKNILARIVDSLKQNNNLELALRVYGHRSIRETNNCKDTWLEVPFRPNNHKLIIDKINEIKPKGVTPITYSLEQCANDFPAGPGYRNIVILITDGIESCSGDPCAASRALQQKGVFLRPYIIGLGLRAENKLDCVGKYIDAETPGEFNHVLNEAIETSFAKTTVSIELLGENNQPTESNVNVSFINAVTGAVLYDLVHYRDRQGKPDSITIDPLVEYDLVVNTVPPVVQKQIRVATGKHTVVNIPVPQGNLLVQQDGRRDNNLQVIVRLTGKPEVLNVQRLNESFRYLAGTYAVETLTLPRRIFTVKIDANKNQTITLPSTGVVNFNTITAGYGSLYEIDDKGHQTWVCNLNDMKPQFSLHMLPGRYKIVFRVRNTAGSKYTAFKTFTLKSGETISVNVFN
jgi:Ca-activated chloride channel homolog